MAVLSHSGALPNVVVQNQPCHPLTVPRHGGRIRGAARTPCAPPACPQMKIQRWPGAQQGPGRQVRSHEGQERSRIMDVEKYTDRAKGFLQSAQGLAIREGHQRFLPEHLLKVLLDDSEGMATNLIHAAGGDAKAARAANDELLRKIPKVEGGGAGQLYMAPETARLF